MGFSVNSSICSAIAVLLFALGCSSEESGPACFPVRGEVRLDGEPLGEAMILFHPVDKNSPTAVKPLANSDLDGRFEMTTFQRHDGAPPGEYAITVELRALRPDGDEMIRDGRNLLPGHYRDPARSGFKFMVKNEPNEVPVINLQSK